MACLDSLVYLDPLFLSIRVLSISRFERGAAGWTTDPRDAQQLAALNLHLTNSCSDLLHPGSTLDVLEALCIGACAKRQGTTLSSRVHSLYAINFEDMCGANLVS